MSFTNGYHSLCIYKVFFFLVIMAHEKCAHEPTPLIHQITRCSTPLPSRGNIRLPQGAPVHLRYFHASLFSLNFYSPMSRFHTSSLHPSSSPAPCLRSRLVGASSEHHTLTSRSCSIGSDTQTNSFHYLSHLIRSCARNPLCSRVSRERSRRIWHSISSSCVAPKGLLKRRKGWHLCLRRRLSGKGWKVQSLRWVILLGCGWAYRLVLMMF